MLSKLRYEYASHQLSGGKIYKFCIYQWNNKKPFLLNNEKVDVNQNYIPVEKLLFFKYVYGDTGSNSVC